MAQHKKRINKMFWVNILRCANGSYYTGHTDNLERRHDAQRLGGSISFGFIDLLELRISDCGQYNQPRPPNT
jgi:hypothetical protein